MPPTPKPTVLEIEEVSEDVARKHLGEAYADAGSALKFFDGMVAQREKALKQFHAELGKNQELATAFAQNPVGMLNDRGLIGPLDRINIEDLVNPFKLFPWPFPFCRIYWVLECRWERSWVCVKIFGFRWCWPVWHLYCKWVARIHCYF